LNFSYQGLSRYKFILAGKVPSRKKFLPFFILIAFWRKARLRLRRKTVAWEKHRLCYFKLRISDFSVFFFNPRSAMGIPQFGGGISGRGAVKKERPSSEALLKGGGFLVYA